MGKSIQNHPVLRQLLRLRYCMEKLQSLDHKLKYQVDRLLQLSNNTPSSKAEIIKTLLRPNLSSLLDDDDDDGAVRRGKGNKKSLPKKKASRQEEEDDESIDDDEVDLDMEDDEDDDDDEEEGDDMDDDDMEDDDEEEDEEQDRTKKDTAVYRAPKVSSVPYPNEKEADKQEKQLHKLKQKMRTSELLQSLQDEFGDIPEQAGSTGMGAVMGDLKRLEEEEDERREFEEERFVRMVRTRKEKQDIKRREKAALKVDNFDDLGDFESLDKLNQLEAIQQGGAGGNTKKASLLSIPLTTNPSNNKSSMKSLQRAAETLQSDKKSSLKRLELLAQEFQRGNNHGDDDDDDEDNDDAFAGGRKRRRAPEGRMHDHDDIAGDEEDDGGVGNVYDDFVSKKQEYQQAKDEHYKPAPRFGGFEENVDEGKKRAASYEIIKNRGLTPHRKKANRNPRVKKREAYDKKVKARKGQVQDVIKGESGRYGGEMSGVKAHLAKSRKLK